jgi:hypothetical protein
MQVWLLNLDEDDQTVCNVETIDDLPLERLQYLVDHDYKYNTIVEGYVRKDNKKKCVFSLEDANRNLTMAIVFGTVFPFFLFWISCLQCYCMDCVHRHSAVRIPSLDGIEINSTV